MTAIATKPDIPIGSANLISWRSADERRFRVDAGSTKYLDGGAVGSVGEVAFAARCG